MCGLCGEIRFDSLSADIPAVQRMTRALTPRGPDSGGLVAKDNMALGHRRLRILDLSDRAAQPLVDPHLGLTLVFNGCIYNFRELREELIEQGYRFFTEGDSEVILKAWHAWKEHSVERFHGMFAFALWERDSGRLILARDRMGIKPLYMRHPVGSSLRFASTLPALLAGGEVDTELDPVALHHYMTFHAVVPGPRTLLKGVRKLPPATVRIFEPNGHWRDHPYWTYEPGLTRTGDPDTPEAWVEALEPLLVEAVRRRLVADVPVGVLLSGGLDSSLITGLLAQLGQTGLQTFSVGFEDAGGETGNEFRYSDLIARHYGTIHHRLTIPSRQLLDALPATIRAMSEPMVSHDNVGFFLLSREVARHVKVVQSGQGADEIFAGYHWYPPLAGHPTPVTAYAAAFFDRDHADFKRAIHPDRVGEDFSTRFVSEHFAHGAARDGVDQALRLDGQVMLTEDPVKRVDNMTMAWGLEARVPFLDHALVEFAARIPAPLKLAEQGKGILKRVARRIIPHEVIDRPKGYFPVPALKYLHGPLLEQVREGLTGPTARQRKLFQADYVKGLLDHPMEAITPLGGSKLWQLALLEFWLQAHDL